MRIIVLILVLGIGLAGCATGRRGADVQTQQMEQLQSRISDLEAELKTKNREISDLERVLEQGQEQSVSGAGPQENAAGTALTERQIQTALKNAGFYQGTVDGKIGKKTKTAIKAFQKANGLKADGVVGRRTRAGLKKYLER